MRILRSVTPLAFCLLSVAASVPDAHACGMSVRLEPLPAVKKTPVQLVASAEKALEQSSVRLAGRGVLDAFPKGVRNVEPGKDPVETRALRVFALMLVRTHGSMDEHALGSGPASWTPRANLAWAVQALREIDAKRPNDPSLQADLGEALAQLPESEGEALLLLGKLAQKDLMGSPQAYAALARLRAKTGDAKGAEAARTRCEEMTKSKDVCKPEAEPAKPSAAAKA